MRITKEGILPEEQVHAGKCKVCGTEFEFLSREGKHKYDQRDGEWIEIDCPLCTRLVFVYPSPFEHRF